MSRFTSSRPLFSSLLISRDIDHQRAIVAKPRNPPAEGAETKDSQFPTQHGRPDGQKSRFPWPWETGTLPTACACGPRLLQAASDIPTSRWLSRTLAALEIGLGTFGQGLACSKPPNESRQKGALARECWRLRADILTRGPGDWRGPMPVLPAMANRRTTSRKGCQTNRCRLMSRYSITNAVCTFHGCSSGCCIAYAAPQEECCYLSSTRLFQEEIMCASIKQRKQSSPPNSSFIFTIVPMTTGALRVCRDLRTGSGRRYRQVQIINRRKSDRFHDYSFSDGCNFLNPSAHRQEDLLKCRAVGKRE